MEKAPNRELGIVGFGPIFSTKQPCDLGQDTCFTSAVLSVNTVYMRMLGPGEVD